MIGIKQGISKMAVYNDKQNLKALEELKALGVNDLSPVLLLFKSGINLLTRFGKTNPINFDKI